MMLISTKFPNSLLFLSSLLIISIELSVGDFVPTYLYHNCTNAPTYAPNSIYQNHLRIVLSSLSSAPSESHNTSAGEDSSSPVYGSFFCRGDVNITTCRVCVTFVAIDAFNRCPVQKEAVIWYDECQLRYSYRSFFGTVYDRPSVSLLNAANITDQNRFNRLVGVSTKATAAEAAKGLPGDKKFATKEDNFNDFQRLFTLAQCTPDLNASGCTRCLNDAIARLPICCFGKLGGRVLFPSCNVRYEVYPFYGENATAPPPAAATPLPPSGYKSTTKGKTKTSSIVIVISVVVPFVATFLLLICCYVFHMRARKNYNTIVMQDNANDLTNDVESLQFNFKSIETATSNFSDDNMLGKGGFGDVYKAWQLWKEKKVLDLMDACLKDSCTPNEFLRYVHIALLCVQEDANLRPTMSSVVSTLRSEAPSLSQPERPAFVSSRLTSHQELIPTNTLSVNNGMTITEFLPR
ncbi:hypothetical protein G4B88_019766 [Cannabis sativa]|uniref:Gnk2-homologous domain-containing protein n=1 Tax=Cannabis sativa TaxID=3483 RepID=A0A7J6HST3_CANSA|nr:hypothetical protein G4B88_019766 [Cannabis sativa]